MLEDNNNPLLDLLCTNLVQHLLDIHSKCTSIHLFLLAGAIWVQYSH